MPHPKQGYHLADGTRIPGVTTITGRFKDSGALIKWAYNQGKEGKDLYETRDKAAEAGTLAHAMVEAHINGDDPESALADANPEVIATARSAFEAYRSWESMSRLEVVDQERSLVSEEYRFGGTPDGIVRVNGELALCDWKTSNSVYPEMLIQLAAYRQLWEENFPDQPLTGGFHLCRFAKEHGDFSHHYFPNLDEAWRQFVLLREAYEHDKQLKKRAS